MEREIFRIRAGLADRAERRAGLCCFLLLGMIEDKGVKQGQAWVARQPGTCCIFPTGVAELLYRLYRVLQEIGLPRAGQQGRGSSWGSHLLLY